MSFIRGSYFNGLTNSDYDVEDSPEIEELKKKIIYTLKNYDEILADIEREKMILELPSTSKEEKEIMKKRIRVIEIRLKYIDNLVSVLNDEDRKILYMKYVLEKSWEEVYASLSTKKAFDTIRGRGPKIKHFLAVRCDKRIFEAYE